MPRRPRALFLQYTNPGGYPPLQHVADLLLARGWELLFLGVRGSGGASSLALSPHERMTVRTIRGAAPGWRQKLNYLLYVAWAFAWRLRWRPDCVYASDLMGALPALAATLLPVRCRIYHEHDSPPAPSGAFARALHWARGRVARGSDAVVLPNAERAKRLCRDTGVPGERVMCVWNCPALSEVPPAAPTKPADVFWLLYHGSIVADRLPLTLLDALARSPGEMKLRIVGYETVGSRGYVGQLLERAAALGIGDRVEFLGVLSRREDLLAVARDSHLGLALMPMVPTDVNMRHMTGASNKPFEYMASGCALLVSALPDWESMFVAPGYGLACDPQRPDSIAQVLAWCWEHRQAVGAMGDRGHKAILESCHYERQFEPVLALIARAEGRAA